VLLPFKAPFNARLEQGQGFADIRQRYADALFRRVVNKLLQGFNTLVVRVIPLIEPVFGAAQRPPVGTLVLLEKRYGGLFKHQLQVQSGLGALLWGEHGLGRLVEAADDHHLVQCVEHALPYYAPAVLGRLLVSGVGRALAAGLIRRKQLLGIQFGGHSHGSFKLEVEAGAVDWLQGAQCQDFPGKLLAHGVDARLVGFGKDLVRSLKNPQGTTVVPFHLQALVGQSQEVFGLRQQPVRAGPFTQSQQRARIVLDLPLLGIELFALLLDGLALLLQLARKLVEPFLAGSDKRRLAFPDLAGLLAQLLEPVLQRLLLAVLFPQAKRKRADEQNHKDENQPYWPEAGFWGMAPAVSEIAGSFWLLSLTSVHYS